jgi:hypothetical protein
LATEAPNIPHMLRHIKGTPFHSFHYVASQFSYSSKLAP